MTDGVYPAAGGSFLGSLLSEEEVQELLAPLDVGAEEVPEPLLLVAKNTADAERVILHLMARDVPVVPTESYDDALDLLHKRNYLGLIATAETLGPDLGPIIDSLRAVRPEMRFGIITDPGVALGDVPVEAIPRPAVEIGIDRFLRRVRGEELEAEGPTGSPSKFLADQVKVTGDKVKPSQAASRERLRLVAAHRRQQTGDAPGPAPWQQLGPCARGEGATASTGPDPLLGVQALLEAKAAGDGLAAGLRRWAERDPAILGVAECHLDEAEWRLRAATPVVGERHRMLLLLLDHLGESPSLPDRPVAAGPFSLFPLFRSPHSCVALWHQDAVAGRELLLRLRPLLPLIEALPETSGHEPAAAVRERFIALLEARMSAMDRGKGQLGVLLVEAPPGESPALLCRDLKALLRGGDWIDVVGNRLYVILDHPGKGTMTAIGDRLRKLPAIEQLRVVALGWDPGQGRATALVGRAERLLEEGGLGLTIPASGE